MKIRKKYIFLILLGIVVMFYLFWGPLFPWSPVKPGYEEINTPRATIYISDRAAGDSAVYHIEDIIGEAEKFHDSKYTDDFKIVILNKESNMRRYLPWMKGSGFSVSLSRLNLIYVGSIARKSKAGIEPYIKHELSHLLIDQNTTLDNAMKIHDQGWMAEGIAEYFGQRSFYSKAELVTLAQMKNLSFETLNEANPLDVSFGDLKLKYSYYRFFIEFLIENYGIKKLQKYLKMYIDDPDAYKDYFIEVYAIDLDRLLKKYKASLF